MLRPVEYNFFEKDYELQSIQIPFAVSLAVIKLGHPAPHTFKMTGHTRRLSASELELVGPFILFSSRSAFGKKATLYITLELPRGAISFQAVAVSYTQLDESETNMGYIVAARDDSAGAPADMNGVIRARITEISDKDRRQLLKFMRDHDRTLEQTVLVVEKNGQWQEHTMTVTVIA